jgi:hypothetical protein
MSQNLRPPLSHNVTLRRPPHPLTCDVIYGWLLKGFAPIMGSQEIVAGLREKGIENSHAQQINKNIVVDGGKQMVLLSL